MDNKRPVMLLVRFLEDPESPALACRRLIKIR